MKPMVPARTLSGSILLAAGALGAAAALTACTSSSVTEKTGTPESTTAQVQAKPAETPPSTTSTEVSKTLEIPDPATARASYREGALLFQKGEYEDAVTKLQTAARGRPDHAYTQYLLGLSEWKSGHAQEAEVSLAGSGEIDPTSEKTWVNLGRVRMELGNSAGALEASEKALGIQDGSPNALHVRGRALAALGRNDEALETLTRAHDADPENGWIANTLGLQLIMLGRPGEAVPALEQARDRLPNVAFVRNNLGVAYERIGDVEKAVEEYVASVHSGDSDGKAGASLSRLEPVLTRMIAEGRVKPTSETPALARTTSEGDQDGTAGVPKQ